MKRTPLLRKTAMKRGSGLKRGGSLRRGGPLKRSGPMSRVSTRMKTQLEEYFPKAKAFLARLENMWCPVAEKVLGKKIRTCQVHHIHGRVGALLLNENHWMGVSKFGHDWIHFKEPAEARKLGWLR